MAAKYDGGGYLAALEAAVLSAKKTAGVMQKIGPAVTAAMEQVALASAGAGAVAALPGATIAQQAAAAGKTAGVTEKGPPKKVATAKGEAKFKVPIGSLIIPHLHYVHGQPSHWIPNVSEEKWIANYWKDNDNSSKEAEKAVAQGTHHWVDVGSKHLAVHNGLDVHVPKTTDISDDAAVKKATKVFVKHGTEPEHMTVHPAGAVSGASASTTTAEHSDAAADALAKNWQKLPSQPSKKSVTVKGKHAAWVPSDWKVYKGKGVPEEKISGKFAVDTGGHGHLITPGKIENFSGIPDFLAKDQLEPDDDSPGPEPGHAAPSGDNDGPEPVKAHIGGVSATKQEVQHALQVLHASGHSTQIKQPLAKAGNVLADADYHAVYKQELEKFPELKMSPGSKKQHVPEAKNAFMHALSQALEGVAKTEAEQDAAQAAKDKAEAEAAHAQVLTPHEHTLGGAEGIGPPGEQQYVQVPGVGVTLSKHDIAKAIEVLQASGLSTAVKQPLAKAGSLLEFMDYHKVAKDEIAAHPELKHAPGTKLQHVPQVKAAVIHYLQGKLGEFKSGGTAVSKTYIQEAIDLLENSAGGKLATLQAKLLLKDNPLAKLNLLDLVHQYEDSHPVSSPGMTVKQKLLAYLTEHQQDMIMADQETGHDKAALVDELLTSANTGKFGWQDTSSGAIAMALMNAQKQPAYVWLDDGKWGISWAPPTADMGKAYFEATPEHKVFMHLPDDGKTTEFEQDHILDILHQWVQPEKEATPSQVSHPQTVFHESTPKAEVVSVVSQMAVQAGKGFVVVQAPDAWKAYGMGEVPPAEQLTPQGGYPYLTVNSAGEVTHDYTPAEPVKAALVPASQWEKEPDWATINDLVTSAKAADVPPTSSHDTNDHLARTLWVASKVGTDKWLHAHESGSWLLSSQPPQSGTWGANTAAGHYHVTPDHQIVHVAPDGTETAFSAEQVLSVASILAPKQKQAGGEAEGFDVSAAGKTYHAPAGSQVYVWPEFEKYADFTPDKVKYVKEPSGKWTLIHDQGVSQIPKADGAVEKGTLVPLEGQPVTVWYDGKSYEIPAGSKVYGDEKFPETGFKYAKLPDGTWTIFNKYAAGEKSVFVNAYDQMASSAQFHELSPEEVQGKVPVSWAGNPPTYWAPAGTTLWYTSASSSPGESDKTTIYLKLPDNTWQFMFSGASGTSTPANPALLDDWLPKGALKPYGKEAEAYAKVLAAPEQQVKQQPEPPAGEVTAPPPPDVAVKFPGKEPGHAPAGSKVYWYSGGLTSPDQASAKYVKYPDGSWWVYHSNGTKDHGITAGYDSYIASGSFTEEAPSPVEAGVPVFVKGKVVAHVPAGSLAYHGKGADPDTANFKYVQFPDGTWKRFGVSGEASLGAAQTPEVLMAWAAGGTLVKDAEFGKEPEKPGGVPVLVGGQKQVTAPAGSKVYAQTQAVSSPDAEKYVLYPTGSWHHWGWNGAHTSVFESTHPATSTTAALLNQQVSTGYLTELPGGNPPPPPPAPEGPEIPVIFGGVVKGTVPAGSKLYKSKTAPASFILIKLPDGTWSKADSYSVSKMNYGNLDKQLADGNLEEVPLPTGEEVAHAEEVGKLKDLFKNGAMANTESQKSALAMLVWQLTSGTTYSQYAVMAKTSGTGFVYQYTDPGKENWQVDKETLEVTHHVPDGKGGTDEKLPFSVLKEAADQHVQPDSTKLYGTIYKNGFWYNPKGKAYLEIKPTAYSKSGHFVWHQVNGATKEVSIQFAKAQLEKNTEWHAQPKPPGDAPSVVKQVKFATVAGPGIQYTLWSQQQGAKGDGTLVELKEDGSAVVHVQGAHNPLVSADPLLQGGSVLDSHGTTVVKPGLQPDAYHVFGSKAKTAAELTELRDALQQATGPGYGWQAPVFEFFGGTKSFPPEVKPFVSKFYQDAGYNSGEDQRIKFSALLNELLLVPQQDAASLKPPEPVFLKSLPEGVSGPKDIFKFTGTGYAHPFSGGITLEEIASPKAVMASKIKAISAEFGGGKVVGTHISGLTTLQATSWLKAWKSGDMEQVFALDALGGKVSPAHPGAPKNTDTHKVNWAPWDTAQIPASVDIEGNWTPLDGGVSASQAEVSNYLIKANVQHAAYLSLAERRALVKAHRQHDQDTVDKLSKQAAASFSSNSLPQTEPPAWTDNVQPAKAYDVFMEDGKGAEEWTNKAVTAFLIDYQTELVPFAKQWGDENGVDASPGSTYWQAYYAKNFIQPYLDDVKAKEEKEKLRPKWALVPGDPTRVQDQFGHKRLWLTGSKAELNRRVAVAALARSWGFRLPLSEHAFLEADKTPGVITPEQFPLSTLASATSVMDLEPREITDIAREHVLDWALANATSTPGHYLVMADGSVISASKEGAFKGWTWQGQHLDGLNDFAVQPVHMVLNGIMQKLLSKDTADAAYIAAVQAARRMAMLSDDRMKAALKGTGLEAGTGERLQVLLDRKNSLPADIQGLWDEAFAKAGWAPPEVPEAKLSHGLHSGFSEPDFFPHVLAAKSFGVPAFFAGGDLADGHVHVWTEYDGHGVHQVRGEATIRGEALKKVVAWVDSHTGEASAMAPKGEDIFHAHIKEAAKVVSDHATIPWGPITQQAYDKMQSDKYELEERLSKAETVKGNPAAPAYKQFVSAYGDPGAVISMAKFYLAQVGVVEHAGNAHQTLSLDQFPGWLPAEHASVVAGGVKVTYKKASRELGTAIPNFANMSTEEQLKWAADTWPLGKEDGELHLKAGLSTQYPGYVWEVKLPSGESIDVSNESKSNTPKASQGRIRFRAVAENGSASLQNIRSFLQEAGLPMDEATQADMENLYWRLAASVMADRADRKSSKQMQVWKQVASAAGTPLKELPYIGKITEKLAEKHLPTEEENAIWRKAFSVFTSPEQIQQFTDSHRYLPHLSHNDIRDAAVTGGRPDWYRFDLTPQQVAGKKLVVNNFHNSITDAVLISRTGGLFSSEGRLRALGVYKPGMSWGADIEHGSSGTVFLRQNLGSSSFNAWISPRVLARLKTYTFPSDEFGEIDSRRSQSYWDFDEATKHTGGSNEAMIPDAVTLLDDVELIKAYSEAQRKQIIKDLKDAGVTEIRGLPVEDRIITAGQLSASTAKVKDLLKKQYKDWFTLPEQPYVPGSSPLPPLPPLSTEAGATAAESGAAAKAAAEPDPESAAGLLAGAGNKIYASVDGPEKYVLTAAGQWYEVDKKTATKVHGSENSWLSSKVGSLLVLEKDNAEPAEVPLTAGLPSYVPMGTISSSATYNSVPYIPPSSYTLPPWKFTASDVYGNSYNLVPDWQGMVSKEASFETEINPGLADELKKFFNKKEDGDAGD